MFKVVLSSVIIIFTSVMLGMSLTEIALGAVVFISQSCTFNFLSKTRYFVAHFTVKTVLKSTEICNETRIHKEQCVY